MSPFQRARDEALRLRGALLGTRADTDVRVGDFLNAEVIEARLNFGVAYVARGSKELAGADAVLCRSERFIYICESFDPEDRAYLLAHELGHLKLDDEGSATTIASLATAYSGTTSPAVIQIEAYGARERQELRANVFARELLLPRSVARRTFLSGRGPTDVSKACGIAIDIVRQQMLDAVLLPALANAPAKPSQNLTPDQQDAAKAAETFVNVVAGPGSGKTTTLIQRVRHLVQEEGVPPAQILVLTFTNKAAFELVDRLKDAGVTGASDVWAGTFHAFGLEFFRKYHKAFGLDSEVVVADKLAAVSLLNAELPKVELQFYGRLEDPYLWISNVVEAITRLKEEMVSPQSYRESVLNLVADEATTRKRLDVATLYERHEELLKAKKLVDFVDLIAKPAKALREDRPRYGEVADRYRYIMVDEYQDVTKAMRNLLLALAKNARSLWVVGDVRQAIHHWRGASIRSLLRFQRDFMESGSEGRSRQYALQYNRRSTPQIVSLINQVGTTHVLQDSLPLIEAKSRQPKGSKPTLTSCQAKSGMTYDVQMALSQAILERVRGLSAQEVPYGAQAVLSRTNAELANIAATLENGGVPTLFVGELIQRPEVKALLCLMQLLVERRPQALGGLKSFAELAIGWDDLSRLQEACSNDQSLQRGGWRRRIPEELRESSKNVLKRVAELTAGHSRSSNAWDFVCDLLLEKRFALPMLDDVSNASHVRRIALWQFAYTTRASEGAGRPRTLSRFLLRLQLLRRIGETFGHRELPPESASLNAVGLMTVHGSKGLEFPVVHFPGVSEWHYSAKVEPWGRQKALLEIIPPEVLGLSSGDRELELGAEKNNLLYVGVSRAKTQLFLYQSAGDVPALSLQSSTPLLQVYKFQPKPSAQAAVMAAATPFIAVGYEELRIYSQCRLQHWYRYILKFVPEQHVDVSVRARSAIDSTLQEVARNPSAFKKATFTQAWEVRDLPSPKGDERLWLEAVATLNIGLQQMAEFRGQYAEPVTHLNGASIQLPWVLARGPARPELLYVRAHVPGGSTSIRFWRPMLNDLKPASGKSVTIVSLAESARVTDGPSGSISKTAAYRAVRLMHEGDRAAVPGEHCDWCAYMTICPNRPGE